MTHETENPIAPQSNETPTPVSSSERAGLAIRLKTLPRRSLLSIGLLAVLIIGVATWFTLSSSQPANEALVSTSQSEDPGKSLESQSDTDTQTIKDEQPASATSDTPSSPAVVEPQPKPQCQGGTASTQNGKTICTFRIDAQSVPARLEAYLLQSSPRMNFYDALITGTCVVQEACKNFGSDTFVTTESKSRIDWRIVKPTVITIDADAAVMTDSVPQATYQFSQFQYSHPADNICTSERLYCYTLSAEYDKH